MFQRQRTQHEVLTRWADRTRGRDAERLSYLLVQILQPYPTTLAPPDAAHP